MSEFYFLSGSIHCLCAAVENRQNFKGLLNLRKGRNSTRLKIGLAFIHTHFIPAEADQDGLLRILLRQIDDKVVRWNARDP